jgi:hypothetical protein
MATTTNYGWTTPNDTDLVKDGAAAIRTLGSSVDTTTKALNPSTTLGDIEYRSATANTNTRLGIGTTGQVLTVTGGVPAWSTISAGGMTLISTTSLSGSTTTLSSIPSTYKHLLLTFTDILFTANSKSLQMRVNGLSTGIYSIAGVVKPGSTGVPDSYSEGSATESTFGSNLFGSNNTAETLGFGSINLYDYTSNLKKQGNAIFRGYNGSGFTFFTGNYSIDVTSTISSITILSNGTFSTGAVKLYGVE